MNLSDAIIHADAATVKKFVDAGAKLDEIDNYGYSPLVQTAIVNQMDKAKIVLDAGADINFSDLTGRTALHWAVDNGNMEFARMLLQRGANPNLYTRAGQPVLVMPMLRGQDPIKKLLYQHNAKIDFAQDFINGKSLGHRFELEGRVDVVDYEGTFIEIELEGFYLEFSLALVVESLREFKRNFGGKHLRHYFGQLQVIADAIDNAATLIRYQHYLIDIKEHEHQINRCLSLSPLVIPVVYSGHAICLIALKEYLIRCDRGAYGREHGTVIVYRMGRPQRLDREYIKQLIYKKQDTSSIDEGLIQDLQLERLGTLPLSEQVSGNCTWANVEAVVPTLMFLLLLQGHSEERPSVEKCQADAMYFYEQWLKWDQNRALAFCVQSFYSANPARKASKAALLAAILFQDYDFENPEDRSNADKFIPILRHPDYRYIVKAYVEVFQYDRDNPLFQNLMKFIDYFEIDID